MEHGKRQFIRFDWIEGKAARNKDRKADCNQVMANLFYRMFYTDFSLSCYTLKPVK